MTKDGAELQTKNLQIKYAKIPAVHMLLSLHSCFPLKTSFCADKKKSRQDISWFFETCLQFSIASIAVFKPQFGARNRNSTMCFL